MLFTAKQKSKAGSSHEANVPSGPLASEQIQLRSKQPEYLELKERIHQRLVSSLDLAMVEKVDDPAVKDEIERLSKQLIDAESGGIAPGLRQKLFEDLQDELFRCGPLEPLLNDPTVSDILVNHAKEVFIERNGRLEESDVVFTDDQHLMRIVQRIVGMIGRRLDRSSPLVDARLPDGSRVNAVIPPLAIAGPKLSIRRFVAKHFDVDVMVGSGSLDQNMATFLRAAVAARVSVLFSGGTGAGKTTLLSALSSAIPKAERIVTIEDSAELVLQHPHVVSLETRPANQEGSGEYSLKDLVRNSLRMRPDRIIVGEVRGAEAIDMIQAMNTGHEGSMTTLHSNGTKDAISRLELMVAMSRIELPAATVRECIALAFPIVTHIARLRGGVRKITRVSELISDGEGNITVQDIFRYQPTGVDEDGNVTGHFESTGYIPSVLQRMEEQGVIVDPAIFDPVISKAAISKATSEATK